MRIQRLAKPLWTNKPVNDPYIYVIAPDLKIESRCRDAVTAVQKIKDAAAKGVFAFACGPIPCNNNENGVFYYNKCGKGALVEERHKALVRKAYESIMQSKPKPIVEEIKPVKVKAKIDDPVRMVIKVRYNENGPAKYLLRCRQAHFVGDFVTVEKVDQFGSLRYVNVQVGWSGVMTESEILAYAKKIGYKDIFEVYCDQPLLEEEAWEGFPTYYADHIYQEDINELNAMKECYKPAANIVYHGNLPDPGSEDIYCDQDQINEAEEAEVSNLPE